MIKQKFYKDFSKEELKKGYLSMSNELINSDNWIKNLFDYVWSDFISNKFSYDGATFVVERYPYTIFEVASFIHDWFNHIGYVGYGVDSIFIEIMEKLKYSKKDIRLRKFFMIFTFLNVLRHYLFKKDNFKGDINKELWKLKFK